MCNPVRYIELPLMQFKAMCILHSLEGAKPEYAYIKAFDAVLSHKYWWNVDSSGQPKSSSQYWWWLMSEISWKTGKALVWSQGRKRNTKYIQIKEACILVLLVLILTIHPQCDSAVDLLCGSCSHTDSGWGKTARANEISAGLLCSAQSDLLHLG